MTEKDTEFGRVTSIDEAMRRALLGRIREFFPAVLAVYLYGSGATGRTHPESDVDLAILLPRGQEARGSVLLEVRGDLEALVRRRVDLSVLDADSSVVHCKEVVTGGVRIHASDAAAVAAFEMEVLSSYARLCEDRRLVVAAYAPNARG